MIVLMSVSPARMNRSRNAVIRATIASTIGMNIATNVRKTTSSTRIAASRPSSSDVPCSTGGNSASPLYSTVTPAGSTASRTASWTATTASRSVSKMTRSNWASAYAIRPSSENVFSSNGSPTSVIPASSSDGANSSVFSSAMASSIAAFRSGVSSRSPSGAAKTTLSTPPCSSANSDSIRSVAFWVSEPGISNSSLRLPPIVETRTIRVAMMPTHARTTRQGCSAHERVQRANPPVASRSWAARRSGVVSAIAVAPFFLGSG